MLLRFLLSEWLPLRGVALLVATAACLGGAAWCGVYHAEAADSARYIYGRKVAPIIAKCAVCHSGEEPFGGLDISSREALLKGGDNGPAIRVGRPAESAMWQRAADGSMPPINDAPRLPPEEVEILRRWIADGAVWPDTEPAVDIESRDRRRLWRRRRWRRSR